MNVHLLFILCTMATASEVDKQCKAGETCGNVMLQRHMMHEVKEDKAEVQPRGRVSPDRVDLMYPHIDDTLFVDGEPEAEPEPEPEEEAAAEEAAAEWAASEEAARVAEEAAAEEAISATSTTTTTTTGPSAPTSYKMVTSGTCSDLPGGEAIKDISSCRAAAEQLFPDKNFGGAPYGDVATDSDPHGCGLYYGGSVNFNSWCTEPKDWSPPGCGATESKALLCKVDSATTTASAGALTCTVTFNAVTMLVDVRMALRLPDGMHFSTANFEIEFYHNKSADGCAEVCANLEWCKSFDYNKDFNICYLTDICGDGADSLRHRNGVTESYDSYSCSCRVGGGLFQEATKEVTPKDTSLNAIEAFSREVEELIKKYSDMGVKVQEKEIGD